MLEQFDTALVDAMRARRIQGSISRAHLLDRDCIRYKHAPTGMFADVLSGARRHEVLDALRCLLDDLEDHYRKDEYEARDQFQEPHMVLL